MGALLQAVTKEALRLKGTAGRPVWPDAVKREAELCSPKRGLAGFRRWCLRHVFIQDLETKRFVRFKWFAGQTRLAPKFVGKYWLVILKGRQLGVTWLVAAYCLWRVSYSQMMTVMVVAQQKEYAQDFIERIRLMHERLPSWCRKEITADNEDELEFKSGENIGHIRAFAGSAKAARSITGDIVVIDEASRVPDLDKTLQAALPTVDVAGGQVILLSSSAGPQGVFYETWQETYGDYGELLGESGVGPSGFMPVFLHWSERRGRDRAWYERELLRLEKVGGPTAGKQEHPDTPQEAWEYAKGRVYASFTRDRHVGDIDIPSTARRYRAIDWGQTTAPFVCLWIAHVPGPPGFLVSPACPNAIRECFAYRWDEDRPDQPLDKDNHTCDAFRYAVVTFNLTGLIYVYRELYLTDCVEKGWTPMKQIKQVHEMSDWEKRPGRRGGGWTPGDRGEIYEQTVADRSWPLMIAQFNEHQLDVVGAEPIRGRKGRKGQLTDPGRKEVLEGIRAVQNLIDGTIQIAEVIPVRREQIALAVAREDLRTGVRAASGLEHASLKAEARRLLKARDRRRRRR